MKSLIACVLVCLALTGCVGVGIYDPYAITAPVIVTVPVYRTGPMYPNGYYSQPLPPRYRPGYNPYFNPNPYRH